ncbi:MAG: FAD-dependent oxidoreductase [Prolixibacteraceae bacterium]|nr:FAD-dependent oxidoreductase [Prolixibacteraceae bacterium]
MFKLKNEFLVPPLKLGYTTGDGKVNNRHIDFYNQRSKHVGAVTLEPLYLDKGLRELPTQLGIDSDDKIEGLSKLVNLIHKNGAKVIAHLNHPGRMANPKIPGNFHWSATNKACENGGANPKAMTREMMDTVINLKVDTARRAEKCGFDFVELQFGHGYLMAQFLSPAVNDRTDEYNGSMENRARFSLEMLDAVKKAINIPIIARLSGDEMIPNGFHIQEMQQFVKMLENHGAAALHVTAGSACSTPPWFFQHMFIPKGKTWELAAKIKEIVSVPVIFVGQINTADDIQFLKEKYQAEYFAVGRALVADPDFVGKLQEKTEDNIRPCLACSEGCLGNVKQGKGLGCVVNPTVNTGLLQPIPTKKSNRIAVVGGGLAGMQAACTLKERGHDVTLFEKECLGGQFNLAWLPPKKESLKKIIDYFKNEIKRLNVAVVIKEATAKDIQIGKFSEVVMATGAVPMVPPIKGLKKYYWTEFLNDDQLPENQRVLIIGGGLIGLEVASKLVDAHNKVIIVEMLDEIARGMEMIEKALTVKKLKEKGTEIFLKHKVVEIERSKIIIENTDRERVVINGIEKIIVATGMKSFIPFEPDEKVPVHIIGDAKQVRKAEEAIHDAYELALKL